MFNYKKDIKKIGGWLTETEALFLHQTAQEIYPHNVIVEIGSWKGKSTICLAKGSEEKLHGKIYAIDPHTGSSEHEKIFNSKIDTYQEFIENIKKAGISQFVIPIRKTSEEAAKKFNEPVGFVFIDGAHEFKFVNLDYKLWFPKIIDHGKVAFHDSWHFPGPHLVTATMLLFSTQIINPKLIDTITCFTKVQKNSFFDRLYNIIFYVYRLVFGFIGYLKLKYKGSVLK